jgi:predicted ArsR family transcriptional regulator
MCEELTTMAGAALADPVRRELLAFVSRSPQPVGRDDAAAALGIPSSTAAFHLERLAEAGFLATEFGPIAGRGGTATGRSPRLYRAVGRGLAASATPQPRPLDGEGRERPVPPPPA